MNTWNSIAWFPICVGLTAVGLVLSYFAWRRKGARRGIRSTAWSLLPLALYLTGSILLVGRIGSAIIQFASSFVFSPKTWSGVTLFILAAVMFLVSGGIPLLSAGKRRARKKELKQEELKQRETAASNGHGAVTTASNRTVAEVGAATTTATAATTRPAQAVKRGKQGSGKQGSGKQGNATGDDGGLDADVAEILRRRGIN